MNVGRIEKVRDSGEVRIERFLFQRAEPQAREILERIAAWGKQHRDTVQTAYAKAPDLDFLEDRDAESWAPLFAILAVADPSRLAELRTCAEVLCGQKQEDAAEEHFAVRLIRDAARVLRDGEKYIASAELLSRLRTIEDSTWNDPSFDARRLAKPLRTFGVKSKPVRIGDSTPRRYVTSEIRECASRYSRDLSATSATPNENKDLGINDVADVALTGPLCEG